MTGDEAEATLERIFPADQCHYNPPRLWFETGHGQHNFSTVPVYNQYAYAVHAAYERVVPQSRP
jgi:hypothetical protein